MDNTICLVKPTLELKKEALEYRREHFQQGERIIYGSELFDQIESYEEWLSSVTLNADSKTVNDFLKDLGNCGYSVRPSERKKGYGTEMLRQLLLIAKEKELKELHISVEKDNIASKKVIQNNGGVYERSFFFENEIADIYTIVL